jgi:hypothetical protein
LKEQDLLSDIPTRNGQEVAGKLRDQALLKKEDATHTTQFTLLPKKAPYELRAKMGF